MKNKKWFFVLLSLLCVLSINLVGCGSNSSYVAPKKIDAVGMQQLLDSHENSIIVDVRTSGEFTELHIKGAVNIPLDKILSGSFPLPDKNTYIFVYCRSGKRSSEAAEHLARDGYSNVYDLGALSNWRGLVERGSAATLSKAL